ncbi:MAG: 2Fe-2S iron-sulfur cluster-binding protein, partial [Armatimonadota bacterium]
MSDSQFRVTFQPQGTAVSVLAGTTILEAAAGTGLVIDTPCGGAGTCGKCKIRITQGETDPSEADRDVFSVKDLRDGWRLACQTAVHWDVMVQVPAASLFGSDYQIVKQSAVSGSQEVLPSIRKVYVELTPPSLQDDASDLIRLEREIERFETDLPVLRKLPKRLRQVGFKGTAVLADHQLLDFEEGDTTSRCYGVAFDLGTTTMVASLVDLCSGQQLAVASELNPQVVFGDDVLARIKHSTSCPHCLEELRRVVAEESSKMIHSLCDEADVNSEHIYEVAYAGNTTMQHLLCGMDSSQLGETPFVPAYGRGLLLSSREMEIPINPHGMVYVFPVIGGFVGGDTVAGILATQLDSIGGP